MLRSNLIRSALFANKITFVGKTSSAYNSIIKRSIRTDCEKINCENCHKKKLYDEMADIVFWVKFGMVVTGSFVALKYSVRYGLIGSDGLFLHQKNKE